jgi:hypothetical protein
LFITFIFIFLEMIYFILMKKYLSKLSFFVIGLTLAATASYLNAWSGPPTGTAPDNNVDSPINVGNSPQTKLGGIGAIAMIANEFCLGSDCITSWSGIGGSSVPAGTVAAFNLLTCPAGWVLADGNNGTRDLRGSFIRGYGTSTAGTAASGAFGAKQEDDFKSHTHTIAGGQYNVGYNTFTPLTTASPNENLTNIWSGGGGSETRPDNVALLFCQKDNTSSGGGSNGGDEFSSLKSINNISTFPNNVVCKNGNNSIILRIESVWGDSNPAQVIYKAQQDQYFLGYRKDNGNIASVSGYNIGTCPNQLSLDGRLTQF